MSTSSPAASASSVSGAMPTPTTHHVGRQLVPPVRDAGRPAVAPVISCDPGVEPEVDAVAAVQVGEDGADLVAEHPVQRQGVAPR